ncbi:Transcription factor MYB108 [Olea europaea subsp. europaea]|uniref:Transcription factor MYB108 n=1 Tax=Olea europaea subsp. europaea TaxID=158383 RepID=A0A8S0UH41_OLEEU|nr:Transcription factor MYB108 [Olea europaea subsp. europaea]
MLEISVDNTSPLQWQQIVADDTKIWAFEAMQEIGDRFARRLGHQSPWLLSWTCTKQPQQRTYDAFFKNIKLHVSTMLHSTEVELGQSYISTLMPFEDCTVPALDDVARDIIPSQLHLEPLASGENVGNSRGEYALVSSGRGGSW